MPTKQDALAILDEMLKAATDAEFSGVSITANWINKRLQAQFGTALNAMPTCCAAMTDRFQKGRDLFRRGRDRSEWYDSINANPSSTFEVFFALPR